MAIDPAAISARPPITISRVELTAPESPAASANGTVSPSAMPITTSRTNRPAVKWDSTCGVSGILWSDLRMRFEVFQGFPSDLAFAAVCKFCSGLVKGKPHGAPHLHPHLGTYIVDASGLVAEKIETHNLKNPLLISPRADIGILSIGELTDQARRHTGFLPHFADGGFFGLFPGINEAFWKGKYGLDGGWSAFRARRFLGTLLPNRLRRLFLGLDDSDMPAA